MDILLTVDLEFNSGGFLHDPKNKNPVGSKSIDLEIDGQAHGLELMLDTMDQYNIKATFFVETVQTLFFGPEPMGKYVTLILERGHDAQLHLHPQWVFCEQIKNGSTPPASAITDSMTDLDSAEISRLIDHGVETLLSWGAPRPVALRTGNLNISDQVQIAMSMSDINIGSNIGIGISQPTDTKLQKWNGRHRVNNVIEVPVFSYESLKLGPIKRRKSLTITGASSRETFAVLDRASHEGSSEVVVLTHVDEMIKGGDDGFNAIKPNWINQKRLRELCQRVTSEYNEYNFVTFREKAGDWLASADAADVLVTAPISASMLSLAQNWLNDHTDII